MFLIGPNKHGPANLHIGEFYDNLINYTINLHYCIGKKKNCRIFVRQFSTSFLLAISDISCTVRALYSLDIDLALAKRTLLGQRLSFRLFLLSQIDHFIHSLQH